MALLQINHGTIAGDDTGELLFDAFAKVNANALTLDAHITATDAHIVSTLNPHAVTKTQVGLSNVENTKVNLLAAVAPGITDDSSAGYSVGSLWTDVVGDQFYICVDASVGAAIWSSGGGGGVTDHTLLTNIGTNTHAQIDTHIADGTVHFTEGSISHTAILNIGTNTHAQLDTHVADGTLHFTEGSISHTAIANIGTNTHAQIDTHIATGTTHFLEGSIDHTAITNIGANTHAQIDTHVADGTLHFLEGAIDHTAILNIGTNTHAQIDTHIADGTIHFTQAAISITESQVSDLGAYLLLAGGVMTGDETLANSAGALKSVNYPVQMTSGVVDGATAVGYELNTTNALSTTGAKPFRLLVNSAEILSVERADITASLPEYGLNVLGTAAFGSQSVLGGGITAAYPVIHIKETKNAVSIQGIDVDVTQNGSLLGQTATVFRGNAQFAGSAFLAQMRGMDMTVTQAGAGSMDWCRVFEATFIQDSTGGMGDMIGNYVHNPLVNNLDTLIGTNFTGFEVESAVFSASRTGTPISGDMIGLKVGQLTHLFLAATEPASAIGVQIAKQEYATTNNIGLWLNGDGVGADIVFGAGKDASIYYDATNLVIAPNLAGAVIAPGRVDVQGGIDLTLDSEDVNVVGLNFSVTNSGTASSATATGFDGLCIYAGTTGAFPPRMIGARSTLEQAGTTAAKWGSGAMFVADYDRTTNFSAGILDGYRVEGFLSGITGASGSVADEVNSFHVADNTSAYFYGIAPPTIRGMYIEKVSPIWGYASAIPVDVFGIEIKKQPPARASGTTAAIWLNGDDIGADILFGAGKDANIYYDNTNLIIDPKLVGTGYVDIQGGLDVLEHAAFGTTATPHVTSIITVSETSTPGVADPKYLNVDIDIDTTGGILDIVGTKSALTIANTGALNTASAYDADVTQNDTIPLSVTLGYRSSFASGSGSGGLGTAIAFSAAANTYTGGTPTSAYGFHTVNQGVSGAVLAIGIGVNNQSGATNNYGIALLGNGAGSDIVFGSGQNASIYWDATNLILNSGTGATVLTDDLAFLDGKNIAIQTTTGTMIGTTTSQKLGLWGATPIIQPTALTTALTQITHTGPTTPDYAIATPINASSWGFSTQDEFETVMSVILNLQTRVDELETKLQAIGAIA